MYFLQSLQWQVSGFQNLIKLLNLFRDLDSVMCWGVIYGVLYMPYFWP